MKHCSEYSAADLPIAADTFIAMTTFVEKAAEFVHPQEKDAMQRPHSTPGSLSRAFFATVMGHRKGSCGKCRIKLRSSEVGDCARRRSCVIHVLLICGTIAVCTDNVQADPSVVFLAATDTTPEREYWNAVLERARSCAKAREFSPPVLCFLKSTPKKCHSVVYDALLGGGEKRKWYLCVISCADAGWYSRTFGDCSRDLD